VASRSAGASRRSLDLRPRFGLLGWFAGSLAHHWDLLWQMTVTDLRGRYVGSSLGLFWSVIHPLVMIGIYTLVFSKIMGARLAGNQDPYGYSLYLCAGLLPWIGFQEVLMRCTSLFPDNANLVRKVAFPKSILYGYVFLSSGINVLLAVLVFLSAYLLTGHTLHPAMVVWLPFIVLQLAFALGLGVFTSVLHVFVRDTAQLVGVIIQVVFWATPVIYIVDALPEWLRTVERFNPLYVFAATHRAIVLDGALPSPWATLALLALTTATLAVGVLTYQRFRAEILDEL
jgi:lipopolysaccharide transport system permease protein